MGNFFFPVEQHFWDCVFLRGCEKKIGNIAYLLTWHRRVLSLTFSFYLWIMAKGSLMTKMLPLGSLLWMETIYLIIWSNMSYKWKLRSEVVVFFHFVNMRSLLTSYIHQMHILKTLNILLLYSITVFSLLKRNIWRNCHQLCGFSAGVIVKMASLTYDLIPSMHPCFFTLFGSLNFMRPSELSESLTKARVWTQKQPFIFN